MASFVAARSRFELAVGYKCRPSIRVWVRSCVEVQGYGWGLPAQLLPSTRLFRSVQN